VSSLDAASELGERVLADFGHVDVLVNNAGITKDRLFVRMTGEDWGAVIGVNLTGAFNVTKAFAPAMLKQRAGSIVNIASVVGQMGNAGQANYAASKAGLIGSPSRSHASLRRAACASMRWRPASSGPP
jgi:3-oxoacyl-[acyl-carrier protein] reductase